MKAKHTKGEWVQDGFHVCHIDQTFAGVEIETATYICSMDTCAIDHEEALANARLIAAAPELLEACKEALEDYQLSGHVQSLIEDVVAKAEGE